jgi:hypothetical protein
LIFGSTGSSLFVLRQRRLLSRKKVDGFYPATLITIRRGFYPDITDG